MCMMDSTPAPLPEAEKIEKPDVAKKPEQNAPLVGDRRKALRYKPVMAGLDALRIPLNLPSATGVNSPK